MTKSEQERFEKRLDIVVDLAEKAIELGRSNSIAQKVTTSNISKLEKAIENVIASSPKIAVLETELNRVSKVLNRLLWSASASAISLIVYLLTHNVVIR